MESRDSEVREAYGNPAFPFVLRHYFGRHALLRSIIVLPVAMVVIRGVHTIFYNVLASDWVLYNLDSGLLHSPLEFMQRWQGYLFDWRWLVGIGLGFLARAMLADGEWRDQLQVTPIAAREWTAAMAALAAGASTVCYLASLVMSVAEGLIYGDTQNPLSRLFASHTGLDWLSGGPSAEFSPGRIILTEIWAHLWVFGEDLILVLLAHSIVAVPRNWRRAIAGAVAVLVARAWLDQAAYVAAVGGTSVANIAYPIRLGTLALACAAACWQLKLVVDQSLKAR